MLEKQSQKKLEEKVENQATIGGWDARGGKNVRKECEDTVSNEGSCRGQNKQKEELRKGKTLINRSRDFRVKQNEAQEKFI